MNENRKIESEIIFKNLLKNPMRMFSLVYIYFFIIALAIGIYFVKNLESISFNTVPGSAIDTLNIDRDIEMKVGGIKPAIDLDYYSKPSDELIKQGKELFKLNCSACHGEDGYGDGAAAAVLNPPARNFYQKDGWTNERSMFGIFKTLAEGNTGTAMIAYEFLPVEDRFAITHYIMSLSEFPEITKDEIASLDQKFNLSAGINVPNNIPVKLAVVKLSDEDSLFVQKINKQKNELAQTDMKGEKILEKVSNKPDHVIRLFAANYSSMNNVEDFIKSISVEPYSLGFNSSILNLTSSEWIDLFNYLKYYSNVSSG